MCKEQQKEKKVGVGERKEGSFGDETERGSKG